MSAEAKKVLVVGPAWVGDMVMSQSLYTFLKQTRPGVAIDVLAPQWSEPILARMPEVDTAIIMPIGHGELGLGRRRKLGKSLREKGYDQAILLPNSLKSAIVPFLAGIPLRTGWRGEMRYGLLNDMRRLDEARLPLMVQRFVALGQAGGAILPDLLPPPLLLVDEANVIAAANKFGLDRATPLLALCPGAEFGAAKRWPVEYYAQLASHYLAQGWQVVLYGSPNDEQVTGEIHSLTGNHGACINLAGQTQLSEVVDLLSLSSAVVSNDSGLMHIAAALDRPMVVVYGPTSDTFTPPLSSAARALVPTIDCAPCFERECPLVHHRCMRELIPDRVIAELDQLLSADGRVL
jgi:lipopolysaccharide heptosyltransferase II